MAYITTSQAARILGVSKKTLMRWDKSGKFSPRKREEVSRSRVYEESEVRDLRYLIDHEKRFRENLKRWKSIREELNPYRKQFYIDSHAAELEEQYDMCMEEHKRLMEEVDKFTPQMKRLHIQFFDLG